MRNLILMLAILLTGIVTAQVHVNTGPIEDSATGISSTFVVGPSQDGNAATLAIINPSSSTTYQVVDLEFLNELYTTTAWSPSWSTENLVDNAGSHTLVQTRMFGTVTETRTISYSTAQNVVFTWSGLADPSYGISRGRTEANQPDAERRAAAFSRDNAPGVEIGLYHFVNYVYSFQTVSMPGATAPITDQFNDLARRSSVVPTNNQNGEHITYLDGEVVEACDLACQIRSERLSQNITTNHLTMGTFTFSTMSVEFETDIPGDGEFPDQFWIYYRNSNNQLVELDSDQVGIVSIDGRNAVLEFFGVTIPSGEVGFVFL